MTIEKLPRHKLAIIVLFASSLGLGGCKPRSSFSESKSAELSYRGEHILIWQSGASTIYANRCSRFISKEDAARALQSGNGNFNLSQLCNSETPPLEFETNGFQALVESVTLSDLGVSLTDVVGDEDRKLFADLETLRRTLAGNIGKIDNLKQMRETFGPQFIQLEEVTAAVNRYRQQAREIVPIDKSIPDDQITYDQMYAVGGEQFKKANGIMNSLKILADSKGADILRLTDEILQSEAALTPILEQRRQRIAAIMALIKDDKLSHVSTISEHNLNYWILAKVMATAATMATPVNEASGNGTSSAGPENAIYTIAHIKEVAVVNYPREANPLFNDYMSEMERQGFKIKGDKGFVGLAAGDFNIFPPTTDWNPAIFRVNAPGSFKYGYNSIFLEPSIEQGTGLGLGINFRVSDLGNEIMIKERASDPSLDMSFTHCVEIDRRQWTSYVVKTYYRSAKNPNCYGAFLFRERSTKYRQMEAGWVGYIGSKAKDKPALALIQHMMSDIQMGIRPGDVGTLDASANNDGNQGGNQVSNQAIPVNKVKVVPQLNQVQLISQPTTPAITPQAPTSNSPTTSKAPGIQIPQSNTKNLQLAMGEVLSMMNEARANFYVAPGQQKAPPRIVDDGVRSACLGNATSISYWSDIVFHFYCQFGQLRACFTSQAQQASKDYAGYEKAYNICAATDNDFKWISDNAQRSQIFKHVMFSVYAEGKTGVFGHPSQDAVINSFYGADKDCNKRPYLQRAATDPLKRPKGQHCM